MSIRFKTTENVIEMARTGNKEGVQVMVPAIGHHVIKMANSFASDVGSRVT